MSNGRDGHGVAVIRSLTQARLRKVRGARSTASGCDGHKSTPLLRLEALEFLERAIWIRARSIMKCLEWSVKSELEAAG